MKTNIEESNNDIENIFVSTPRSLYTELSPSVSMSNIAVFSFKGIGWLHNQIPFVHGIVVGPTAKPFYLFNTLLAKKDFPVLWGPAIVSTAT